MNLKRIAVVAAGALVLSPLGFAAPPPGKGKPPTKGAGCKASVTVVLTGKLAGNGTTAPSTLSVNMTSLSLTQAGGHRFTRLYKHGAHPVSVAITTSTKINRQGDHNPADLEKGDRVNITARGCMTDIENGTRPLVTATRVTALPST